MGTEKIPPQANWQAKYDARKHTEDCLDANDDTSVEKGRCICPKPPKASQHTPTRYLLGLKNGKLIVNELLSDNVHGMTSIEIVKSVNENEQINNALKSALADSARLSLENEHLKNANEELKTALRKLFALIELNVLVRNTENDSDTMAYLKQAAELTLTLKLVQSVLARAEGK